MFGKHNFQGLVSNVTALPERPFPSKCTAYEASTPRTQCSLKGTIAFKIQFNSIHIQERNKPL